MFLYRGSREAPTDPAGLWEPPSTPPPLGQISCSHGCLLLLLCSGSRHIAEPWWSDPMIFGCWKNKKGWPPVSSQTSWLLVQYLSSSCRWCSPLTTRRGLASASSKSSSSNCQSCTLRAVYIFYFFALLHQHVCHIFNSHPRWDPVFLLKLGKFCHQCSLSPVPAEPGASRAAQHVHIWICWPTIVWLRGWIFSHRQAPWKFCGCVSQ